MPQRSTPFRHTRPSSARPLSLLLLLGHVLLLSGCSSVEQGKPQTAAPKSTAPNAAASAHAPDNERDAHGAIWKFFHPEYLEGVPVWGKVLYWAGPGH
jgi:hypothetical protein